MTTEDKSQMPLFSPEDEKEAQKELKRLRKNENGVFKANHKRTGFEDKTLWDWLQLLGVLAIPLVVAGATILFGIQQANLANQQHEADQTQALDQQQAAILQTYIDNIQDLLLNHNLLNSKPGDDIAILARARTLTALQGLDPYRKGRVVQFIYEAQLIGYADFGLQGDLKKIYAPIIDLHLAILGGATLGGATLGGADLRYAGLGYAGLRYAQLRFAYLSGADLSGADLSGADLTSAFLNGAHLRNAHLRNAHLRNATLSGADLSGAQNLTQQQLDQVFSCKDTILPTGLTCHHNQ